MDGGFGTYGTVWHDRPSPAYALRQTVTDETQSASKNSLNDTARIIRARRLDELLASIAEWSRSTCIERAYHRSQARWQLAEFRRLHLHPERRAFEAAVAASQHRRETP